MAEDCSSVRWSSRDQRAASELVAWSPRIDVFERDSRLVTRVDLPGFNQEDVSVLITDDHFAISGERKRRTNDNGCRESDCTFYRAVPLPKGAKVDDVNVTFSNGVLEVSAPLPARSDANVRKAEIEEAMMAASAA